MPASSIDTFLACSIMIILVLAAMASTASTLRPSLSELPHLNDAERFQQLARHVLLAPGSPRSWGSLRDVVPDSFGLSDVDYSLPYQLDIDKVSRLNGDNLFSLSSTQLLQSFGVKDVAFQIEIKTLFNLSTNLVSSAVGANETTYEFEVSAMKTGLPVSAYLRGYIVVKNYVKSFVSSTSSVGKASIVITIPNSVNGTALLLTFAKEKNVPQMVAFNVYAFGHSSSTPWPNRTFARLSPLNYVLNATFTYPSEEVLRALVFTYRYNFSLVENIKGTQSVEYGIPRLLDSSPMLLVITGLNDSSSFAEWSSYPQVPLKIGVDFDASDGGAKIVSLNNIVTINSAMYEVVTKWGGSA